MMTFDKFFATATSDAAHPNRLEPEALDRPQDFNDAQHLRWIQAEKEK
jgi:hypothetical protein